MNISGETRRNSLRRLPAVTAILLLGLAVPGGIADAGNTPAPDRSGAVDRIDASTQQATARYWTPQRLGAATSSGDVNNTVASDPGAPPGTPTANSFEGVSSVGALFFTVGNIGHFCSASVVNSITGNLVLTAAHCINGGKSGSGYRSNVAYVPGYHDGLTPYGIWVAQSMLVADGWQQSSDPNLDFAFITTAPDPATGKQVQQVTRGNWLGVGLGYNHHVMVIAYPNGASEPIECATVSFEAMPSQLQFNCHGYTDGTSGAPWLIGYNPATGTGTVIGDIGGYEEGGDYEYTSYSSYFGQATLKLFLQAELAQLPRP